MKEYASMPNLYAFSHKARRKEADDKSPEWVCDFTAIQDGSTAHLA